MLIIIGCYSEVVFPFVKYESKGHWVCVNAVLLKIAIETFSFVSECGEFIVPQVVFYCEIYGFPCIIDIEPLPSSGIVFP